MWSRFVFWLRIGAAVFAGVAALLALYNHFAKVKLPENFEPWIWGASLAIIMFENVGTLISRRVNALRGDRKQRIEKALMGLMINLAKGGDLRFEELGASVYIPSVFDRLRGRSLENLRLKRIVRFRPAGYPQQSGVAWTPAKGVVGEAWTGRATRHKNWHTVALKYRDQTITPAQFEKLSESTRCGFTRDEFNSIVSKYAEILAEPVWHDGKDGALIGVLSIDRSFIAESATFTARLRKKETLEIAAATASVVSGILKPKPESA